MKTLHLFKKKIPLILTAFCLLVAAAISGTANIKSKARETAAGSFPKKVIVIDAGHDASVIN